MANNSDAQPGERTALMGKTVDGNSNESNAANDDNDGDSKLIIWLAKARLPIAIGVALLFLYWVLPTDNNERPIDTDDDYSGPRFPSTVMRMYKDQKYDHFKDDGAYKSTWSQRYYEDTEFFNGPGSPIFLILGGEDAVHRILYPYISRVLGERFGAYTACLEHRFYGTSQPVLHPTNADLQRLLHPRQALADIKQFIEYKRDELSCGAKGTAQYCPVMTVGASYPGFLSALMRFLHDDIVDIGYASSAPLLLYSHGVNQSVYYDTVTQVAETASMGCAEAVSETLDALQDTFLASTRSVVREAQSIGFCPKSVPAYIRDMRTLREEVNMIVATHFADANMGYYPPGPDKDLTQGCKIFQNRWLTAQDKVRSFLLMNQEHNRTTCYDMSLELPPGPRGTISASDWSGVAGGPAGLMWDYQSCTLIPEVGFSENSMFPIRQWSIDWLTKHCIDRFAYTPEPKALAYEFGFYNLTNATRLLFTNGLNDGWSGYSHLEDINPSVRAINMINGAHHSDLSHMGPSESDTDDVKKAHERISNLIEDWLVEVYAENGESHRDL